MILITKKIHPEKGLRERRAKRKKNELLFLFCFLYCRSRPKCVVPKKNVVKKQTCKMEVSLARALLAASNDDGQATKTGKTYKIFKLLAKVKQKNS